MTRKARKPETDNQSEFSEQELTHLQRLLLTESGRKIIIQAAGGTEEVTMKDVVIRKLYQVAAKGSPHALNLLMRTLEEAERVEAEAAAREVQTGKLVQANLQRRLDEAVKNGEDPDLVIPHPDDVVITEGKGYEICGPVHEGELETIRNNQKIIEANICQYALEQRMPFTPLPPDEYGDEPKGNFPGASAMVEAFWLNNSMPKRFRKDEAKMYEEGDRLATFNTKRQLLKMAHAKWREAGHPKPRGYVSVPLDATIRMFQTMPEIKQLFQDADAGKIKGNRALADAFMVLVRRVAFG